MFKDEYRNSLSDISPDGYIKQKVLNQIENGNKKKTPFKAVVITSVAVAASLVLVFTSIAAAVIINNPFEKSNDVELSDEFIDEDVETSVVTNEGDNYSGTGGFINEYTSSWKGNTEKYEKVYDGDVIFDTSYSEVFKIINDIKNAGSNSWGDIVVGDSAQGSSNNYSATTTTQVVNVDEADVIKTKGNFIYMLGRTFKDNKSQFAIKIVRAGIEPFLENEVIIDTKNYNYSNAKMYIYGNKLIITMSSRETYSDYYKSFTKSYIYDISKQNNPKLLYSSSQSGSLKTSRMIGNVLYLVSNYEVKVSTIDTKKPETFVPVINAKNYNGAVKENTIFLNSNRSKAVYTVIAAFDVNTGNLIDSQSAFGETDILYCSTNSVMITSPYYNGKTAITRLSINKGNIKAVSSKKIKGKVKNQFCIDEYGNHLRVVASNGSNENSLLVFDFLLKEVGRIENIAKGEKVNSAVFDGNIAYFTTYREVDPIITIDLTNPANPKMIGVLKIDGLPNYLFKYGDGKMLGLGTEIDSASGKKIGVKLSMYDTNNPSKLTEIDSVLYKVNTKVLTNYQAFLFNASRNLIGFGGEYNNTYYLLEFKNDKFNLKGEFNFGGINGRGLYIDDFFYIINDSTITVIDLKTLKVISSSNISYLKK